MNITEFLLARIAEDEADLPYDVPNDYVLARLLAECEAKRAIVEVHGCSEGGREVWLDVPDLPEWEGFTPGYFSRDACLCCDDLMLMANQTREWPCRTLRALASVYTTHRDFDPAWA
ncbi:MAG: hypothetical protein IPJ61_21640 [Tessaracoccus sp.]|uniref:DUF6221 family protein n=1 Tax=Tessaracoccus sp. TaxID=1971211 RepID=UPI001ECDBC3E|nr:DUF6221 family protein [Tessaracoccus sp.]MBK7823593.1 hypothetical protein [Tessaracoccus sp.]